MAELDLYIQIIKTILYAISRLIDKLTMIP